MPGSLRAPHCSFGGLPRRCTSTFKVTVAQLKRPEPHAYSMWVPLVEYSRSSHKEIPSNKPCFTQQRGLRITKVDFSLGFRTCKGGRDCFFRYILEITANIDVEPNALLKFNQTSFLLPPTAKCVCSMADLLILVLKIQ